jgi:mono/diheme cytochrome c family protein
MMKKNSRRRWFLTIVLGFIVATGLYYRELLKSAATPNPYVDSPQSVARGKLLWLQDCAACHGPQGRGDGPVSESLPKRPKDLTRVALPPILPDGVLAYRIAYGVEVMPAWRSVLTTDEIWDLVSYIRAQHRPKAD